MSNEARRGGPRLAVFHTHLRIGGVERVLVNLVNALDERGYAVDLLLVSEDGEFRSELSDSVCVIEFDHGRAPGVGVFASVLPLARYLGRVEPDAVLAAKPNPNLVTILACRLASVRTRAVVSFHGVTSDQIEYYDELTHTLKTKLSKYLYPRADRVIAVSQGVKTDAAETLGLDPDDISVVYNPVVTPELRQRSCEPVEHPWFDEDADVPVVLAAGRLHPHKNYSLLVEAFAKLRERIEARLMILGEGQTRSDLEAKVTEHGVEDAVSLPGSTENPYPYMRQASVLAVSSDSEALPSTLIEAMACGCPVVSTNCSTGPAEILEGGEYGRLVPVGDAEALADALDATLRDPPAPERLRDRADDFSTSTVTDEYEELLFGE